MPAANITLYAKWTVNEYTISFEENGGSAVTNITQDYGTAVSAPADPTKEGYTFTGWYSDEELTSAYTFATMPAANITLYAKWTVNEYTITFDSDGGSSVDSITQAYGSAVTAPADPNRTGYTFAGWNPSIPATMPAENLTLTAQWTANTYTVTFDGNGGGTPSPVSKAVTFDSAYGTLATVSRTGYTFNGWHDAPTGGNLVMDTTMVSTASNHILYAQWTINSYTVTFDSQGGSPVASQSVNYGGLVTEPTNPTRTGYTFAGWNNGASAWAFASNAVTGNLTLTAQWTINSYTVTFDSQGGSAVSSQNVNYGGLVTEPTVPTRIGYTFNGWYDASTAGNLWNFASNTVSANTTLYARWITNSSFPTFADVPITYWAWSYIERLYAAGITGGCATTPNLLYCPDNTVTRAQMAVFLLKSMHGPTFTPPQVGDSTGFGDVATSHWAAAWIKQLALEGITGGCGNGNYCPENPVTRGQMAVFLLKAKNGSGYIPPVIGDGSGFTDVPDNYWAAVWIKQLAADGITGGCGAGIYCPESPVTRAQMAVFLVKTFNLP